MPALALSRRAPSCRNSRRGRQSSHLITRPRAVAARAVAARAGGPAELPPDHSPARCRGARCRSCVPTATRRGRGMPPGRARGWRSVLGGLWYLPRNLQIEGAGAPECPGVSGRDPESPGVSGSSPSVLETFYAVGHVARVPECPGVSGTTRTSQESRGVPESLRVFFPAGHGARVPESPGISVAHFWARGVLESPGLPGISLSLFELRVRARGRVRMRKKESRSVRATPESPRSLRGRPSVLETPARGRREAVPERSVRSLRTPRDVAGVSQESPTPKCDQSLRDSDT